MQFWNSHYVRSCRQGDCMGGVPNDLFDMPTYYGKDNLSPHEEYHRTLMI